MSDPAPAFTPEHRQDLELALNLEWVAGKQACAIRAVLAEIDDLRDRAAQLERRRGGECQKCGRWVCPPLTCMGCLADLDPTDELRRTNARLTDEVERLRTEARRYYYPDGTSELLDSAEEVVRRRLAAARLIAKYGRVCEERDALLAACHGGVGAQPDAMASNLVWIARAIEGGDLTVGGITNAGTLAAILRGYAQTIRAFTQAGADAPGPGEGATDGL
jgi:hypothetical protein